MIRGIDISDNNGNMNIGALPHDIAFVALKAGGGLTQLDPDFQIWYHQLRDTRPEIVRICYDFFDWYSDGATQANHILTRGVNFKETGTGPLMLDLEADSGSAVESFIIKNRALCIQRVNDFITTLLASPLYSRKDLIIYSNDDFIKNVICHTWPNTIFWIASYQDDPPPFINGWHFSFWQYSEFGKVTGETTGGYYDLDQFMGTQAELDALANR